MTADPRFLAHAIAVEEEAMLRYRELAETMEVHNNPQVADFFLRMGDEAAKHLAEVRALAGGLELPDIAAWDFDWNGEAPESASYEALHYRMDLRGAMALALANERAAEDFYRRAAAEAADNETASLARGFAEEESQHAESLVKQMAELPGTPEHLRQDDDPAHDPE